MHACCHRLRFETSPIELDLTHHHIPPHHTSPQHTTPPPEVPLSLPRAVLNNQEIIPPVGEFLFSGGPRRNPLHGGLRRRADATAPEGRGGGRAALPTVLYSVFPSRRALWLARPGSFVTRPLRAVINLPRPARCPLRLQLRRSAGIS